MSATTLPQLVVSSKAIRPHVGTLGCRCVIFCDGTGTVYDAETCVPLFQIGGYDGIMHKTPIFVGSFIIFRKSFVTINIYRDPGEYKNVPLVEPCWSYFNGAPTHQRDPEDEYAEVIIHGGIDVSQGNLFFLIGKRPEYDSDIQAYSVVRVDLTRELGIPVTEYPIENPDEEALKHITQFTIVRACDKIYGCLHRFHNGRGDIRMIKIN